jgi:bis(5'-nucleosyl)-tetraphosphatase (symmetrical)
MATYVIGDVQGCYDELAELLERIRFDPAADRLWFTGDLVNRGPSSLAVLRLVQSLGERATTVLGNHDIHLLALAYGRKRKPNRKDTLHECLGAADRHDVLDWLRRQPFLIRDESLGYTLIHAGLPPQWDLPTAVACAREVEAAFAGPGFPDLVDEIFGNKPDRWSPDLAGTERLRFAINCFTRIRYCDEKGRLDFDEKGPPPSRTKGLLPWFAQARRSRGERICFGHWSSLRLRKAEMALEGVYPLDTGCLWGGELTALRLDDLAFFQSPAHTALPLDLD